MRHAKNVQRGNLALKHLENYYENFVRFVSKDLRISSKMGILRIYTCTPES